jgi:beta-glucosidase
MTFPDGFLWGVATSAYQIEGSPQADGKGESIWDRFAHEPGRIRGGGTGDVACDHYRRWRRDFELLSELEVNAYRFSISWPRVFPTGAGRLEQRGLEHYDRLIDDLLRRGITPIVTLYHWDLPQALEERGGWRVRETADRFAEYAAACFDAFGDRVEWWVTVNEPWIVGMLGHLLGLHAPGEKGLGSTVRVFHHLLLAHGRAVQALRASPHPGRAGVALALAPHYAARDTPEDLAAMRGSDGFVNRWFLDPVFKGSYPDDMRALYEERLGPLDVVRDGDLELIAAPSDFLGVNYYTRRVMRAAPGREPFPWEVVPPREGAPMTGGHWEMTPRAFTDLLERLRDDYGSVPILITENGAIFGDGPGADGRVRDAGREQFLREHLAAVSAAIERGVDVRGYCYWSFMDNFEWSLGYEPRFGLVHVDYDTQARTIKDSGRLYARIAAANEL